MHHNASSEHSVSVIGLGLMGAALAKAFLDNQHGILHEGSWRRPWQDELPAVFESFRKQ